MSQDKLDYHAACEAVQALLKACRLEHDSETQGTPQRVAEMWQNSLISGYGEQPEGHLTNQIPDDSGTIVSLEAIPFHGMCPHHLVPYFGTVDLAYEPDGHIVGLGALEKLVASLSRRLILQEELTGKIADILSQSLDAKGVACRVSGRHLCLMLRGREPRETRVVTYAFRGSLSNAFGLFGQNGHAETHVSPCTDGTKS
jgi:GTP cyclohydrolase I